MHPAIIIPLALVGAGAATAIGLRTAAKQKLAAGKTKTIAQVTSTRGAAVDPSFLNSLKSMQDAAGNVPASLVKGTDGSVFTRESSNPASFVFPDSFFSEMTTDDRFTADPIPLGIAGVSGNVLFKVVIAPDMTRRLIVAVPVDPALPDNLPPQEVPFSAVRGA